MDRDSKIIGFIGIECYDLMVYVGQTLHRLGCSCLLVDNSEDGSLAGMNEEEMSAGDVTGIFDVVLARLVGLDDKEACMYDYVLVYAGSADIRPEDYDELYCVTDYQRQNIRRLGACDLGDVCRFLVVRDRTVCGLNPEFLLDELGNLGLGPEAMYEIEDTQADVSAKLFLQHAESARFQKVSRSMQEFVMHVLDVDFETKDIEKAFKAAAKGG